MDFKAFTRLCFCTLHFYGPDWSSVRSLLCCVEGPAAQTSCGIALFVCPLMSIPVCFPLCLWPPHPSLSPRPTASCLLSEAPASPHAWDKGSSSPAQWPPGSSCLSAFLPSPSREYGLCESTEAARVLVTGVKVGILEIMTRFLSCRYAMAVMNHHVCPVENW